MKRLHVPIPIYGTNLYILCPCSAQQLGKFVRSNEGGEKYEDGQEFRGRMVRIKGNGYSNWVIAFSEKWKDNPQDISTLVHECFHVTEDIMWALGIDHNPNTSEAYAYLLDFLVEESLKRIRHRK